MRKPGWKWGPLFIDCPVVSDGKPYRFSGISVAGKMFGVFSPES